MRFALDRYGSRGHFFFEMAFYLHKEFRAAGIRFLSTQRIGGGDLEENGHFLYGKRVADSRHSRHSLFENRSLVDFEIESERKSHKIGYI